MIRHPLGGLKPAPGRFVRLPVALLQQAHQFRLLGQEGVVAVVTDHFAVLGLSAGGANGFGEPLHLAAGKSQSVLMPMKMQPGADAAEGLLRRVVAAQRIPGIHGAQNGEVGVGVEAVDEAPALVVEIAGDIEAAADEASAWPLPARRGPGIFAAAVGIAAVALVEQRRGLVAEHGDLPGQREAAARRLLRQIAAARPLRVVLDGLALQVIERQAHGAQRRQRR